MPELSVRQKAKLVKAVALAVLVFLLLVAVKACAAYEFNMPQQAMARIWCGPNARGETAGGSGTLIDVNAKHEGVVVTNKHVVADGGPYRVVFADGEQHPATLLLVGYRDVDLAALMVDDLGDRQPALWTDALDTETYQLFGFGSGEGRKNFCYMWGSVVGHSVSGAMENFELNAPTRNGDSGGGVFNERGELCGVRWGTGNGSDYRYSTAVHPKNLRDFLSHLKLRPTANRKAAPPQLAPIPQRTTAQPTQYYVQDCPTCPNGQCQPPSGADGWRSVGQPQQPQAPPRIYVPDIVPRPGQQPAPDATIPAPQPDANDKNCCCDCAAKLKELSDRLAALEQRKCEPGPAGPPGPAGKDGRDGVAGPAGADATVDLDALADAVARQLPPIHVIQRDANTGEVIAEKNVPLGGDLTLKFGSKGSVPAKP